MALGVGSKCDVTIPNVTIAELSPGALTFARVTLPASAGGSPSLDLWLPVDERVVTKTIAPVSWPPLAGDIWTTQGITAWVVDDGHGALYFVTADNVRTHATPISVAAALVQFGNSLTLLYRPV